MNGKPSLWFFGILIASRRHKTFMEVQGEVWAYDYTQAKAAATLYGVKMLKRSNNKSFFVVGTTVTQADLIVVTHNV